MLSPQSLENYRSSGQCPPPTTTNFSITVVQNVFCFAWWHVPVQQMLRRIVGQHIALGWPQKSSRNSPSATVSRGRVSIEAMGSNQKHKETNDKQKTWDIFWISIYRTWRKNTQGAALVKKFDYSDYSPWHPKTIRILQRGQTMQRWTPPQPQRILSYLSREMPTTSHSLMHFSIVTVLWYILVYQEFRNIQMFSWCLQTSASL